MLLFIYSVVAEWLVQYGSVLTNPAILGYCQYGSVLPNLAAVCVSICHTVHILTLILSLSLTLTLNLTLISSYLTNKHQYTQTNMSAN